MIDVRKNYGSAERSPELILAKLSFAQSARIFKEIRSIKLVVSEEFPERSMEVVGPGPDGGVQNSASGTAEFSAEAIGLDLELRNGVNRWTHNKVCSIEEVDQLDVVVDTVEQIVVLRRTQTVRGEAATGTQTASVLLILSDTCGELREESKVAPIERQHIDGLFSDYLSNRSILRLQGRWHLVDDNGFRGLTGLQSEIDNNPLLNVDRHVILLDSAESLEFG